MSAEIKTFAAAFGEGSPPVFDPQAGIPSHPYFLRSLRFMSAADSIGRIRLAAITIEDEIQVHM